MPKTSKPKRGFLDGYKTYDDSQGRGNVHEWRTAWDHMTGDQARDIIQNKDPLAVLGFTQLPATEKELNLRYYKLIQIHHPDHGGTTAKAKDIIAAYTILKERFQKGK